MVLKTLKKHKDNLAIEALNRLNLPRSILIIPDGNGRWAEKSNLSTEKGHEAGGKTLGKILENFLKLNTKIIGIWGFSEDNWKRDKEEIKNIMNVVKSTTEENLEKIKKNRVKFMVLGRKDRISKEYPEVLKSLEKAEKETKSFESKILALFLDYGEKYQLEEFTKARAEDKSSTTYELLSRINKGLPLFDMVLRTSGEQRISGFGPLASLAEFIIVKKNLPELEDIDIINALREFSKRERRLGGR